jgi:hypothetical protein
MDQILLRNEIDINDSDAAEKIVQELHKEGGGETYKGNLAYLMKLLMPYKMLAVSIKEGPSYFPVYLASLKYIVVGMFATGKTTYGPFIVDYLVNILYRYKDKPDVINCFQKFFVFKTYKNHMNGGDCNGPDESFEFLVRNNKALCRGNTEKNMRISRYLLQGNVSCDDINIYPNICILIYVCIHI